MNQEEIEYSNTKQHIKTIIIAEIKEKKSNLVQVKCNIEEKFHKALSSIDNAYIERKYMKYCSEFWLQEITDFLKRTTESKGCIIIQETFSSLDKIESLINIPNFFKHLEYYILLIKHYKLVSKKKEKYLVSRFKKECLEQTVAFSNSSEKELDFLENFVDILSFSKSPQSIIAELKWEEFCCGELSFDKFLKGVIDVDGSTYGASLTALQKAAKCLQQEEGLFLIDTFKEVIGGYIKPVEIQERKIDGRSVIEVIGKNVVVSEILCRVENILLKNSNIEEVRFVGADIIHIDTNLTREVWGGRNIAILTKAIKIHDEIAWDVSGKDSNHKYSSNAGTGEDGHGEQGKDGYPGESGGNILIIVERIENPKNFTIISNGGKGSKGQDGGNGRDGKEGKGITKGECDNRFPSVANFFSRNLERVQQIKYILENIRNDSSATETVWYSRANNATIEKIIGDIEEINLLNSIITQHDELILFDENIFIESVTSEGGRITFSFEHGGGFTSLQVFFLYKGSLGQPGGHGGENGLGGQGGYPGEIIVRNLEYSGQEFGIMKNTTQGEGGEKGKGGLYGGHGKNGWDMGYLDHRWWKKAEFRDKGKYKVDYYDENKSDRVWCPYKRKYAAITAANIEHKKLINYEERKSTRQNSDRQHHAQAVKKKNILRGSILTNYSHHLSSVERTFQDLRSDLEHNKQHVLQAIIENQEQQEKKTAKLGIKRHVVSFVNQDKNKRLNETIPSASYKDTNITDGLIDKLLGGPQLLDDWLQLRGIELTRSQLDNLFYNFDIVKTKAFKAQDQQSGIENKLKDIEQVLIDKYRLATLQEIARLLPPYQEVTDDIELTVKSAIRYLVEGKEKGNNISHPILGTLNQYLYENSKDQREKISAFLEEELESSDESLQILKRSLKTFILEVGKSEEAHLCIKKYYDEFLEKQQERSLNIFFEEFKSELSRLNNAKVFHLWIESNKDKSLRSELEEEIKRDNILNALYNRYTNQVKLEFDWDECPTDQDILKEFRDYIREKGPLSESYREVLAYVFDINIRIFAEDQDNGFSLQYNHNFTSKNSIHVLYRANELIQLNINENYLRLEEERKKKDDLYSKILKEIEPLKQRQLFDDYLMNKTFLGNKVLSEDKLYFEEEKDIKKVLSEDKQYFEEEDIKKIIEYFTGEEKQQLKARLGKITFQHIGQQGILHNILKRFSSEGKRVSYQELCFLVNSILSSSIEDRKWQNTFCWIVAAHSQRNWIDELILLKLENRFKRQLEDKSKWRDYLSKIENKYLLLLFGVKLDQGCSISTQCVEDTLHLLSNIPSEIVSPEGLELSEWPYVLKEKYWLCKLLPLTNWQGSEKLQTVSYYLLSLENTFGTDLVKKLLEALEQKKQQLSPDWLTNIFSNFHNEKWNLSEEELMTIRNCNIGEWTKKMQQKFTADKKERDITQLVKLIKGNANTSKQIADNLLKIADFIKCICDGKYAIGGKSVGSFTEKDIENWVKEFRSSINKENHDIEKKMLAIIDRAIEIKRGFKLRDTQRLAVLALLTNAHSTLVQVSTGEGKSLIVVAASLIKALCGEKVDIITSSSVLAKRDAEVNRDIYNLFGINVSHNCSEDIEKRKEVYSSNRIVYGDLSNFQRDYLLDKFYEKNVLGDHDFKNVIVDEVDSMLLDKGNNMLYLSHDIPGLDKLESVYIYIWQWINRPARDHEEILYAFDIKAIKEAVVSDLYGLVKKEDIGKLGSELSEQHKIIIWERLVKAEILDNQGRLLKENIDDNKLIKILLPEFSSYKDRLYYLLKECIERDKCITIPNHLRFFVEKNLESWINSAITVFFMKAGQDYVVDIDRAGTSPDRNPNITILDRDTGTDQANSQWDKALHQFLQLKHGCKLSSQSLKAVFISNVSFFKLYRNLYGLTGTLGSQRERDLLREIHEVDFVTIPTAKSKQFYEDKPILCTGKEEWINHIRNEVKILTQEKKRSVLIICETMIDVEVLHKAFGGKDAKNVHTYLRDYEKFDIAEGNKRLEQGMIIIATNLAGRGTDIQITEGLREAGGLHVFLTYLPSNIRIEQQAFGRAARSGDKGSGQLIVMNSKGQEYSNSRIVDLKKESDAEELYRMSDIKAYYETQITMEERCFKVFKEQYEQMKKNLDDKKVPTEVKGILLQSCLDKWAFWLDENSKCIKNITDEGSKRSFNSLLDKFISQLKRLDTGNRENIEHNSKTWLAWVEGNPAQMVKLGKYLSQNYKNKNAHENAIKLFDEVIKIEPYFCEAAHYYKAFTLAKKIDWEQRPLREGNKQTFKEFKKELRKAARLFDEHSNLAVIAAGIIGKIKTNNNDSIIQIDAYEEQKKSQAELYYIFSRSVDDIFGHTITPQSFVNHDIKETLAESIFKDLLEKGMLKKPRVKKNIFEERLKTISSRFRVSDETLKSFISGYRDINEKEFLKALEKAVKLPSRESFWKLLIHEKVLSKEVKYVVVDNERLKEIDPSLLKFLTVKELKKQTLELNNEQLFLNVECISQQKYNDNIFRKCDFIEVVGQDKYKILKEKRVLSVNKTADVDPSKIESRDLCSYDSITIEDFFNKANITKSEAEKILAELVEQNVLEKKDGSENNAYRLTIKFDEMNQVQLLSCPIYENVVRELLFACFTYRIAIQRIVKQLEEKNFPIRLHLWTKPHQSLVFELLEQKIIRPTMVATEAEDLEKKLKSTYMQLAKEETIKNIVNTLKRSRSSLKALKVPHYKLKYLTEITNVEEVHGFFINGLDQLLQLEEKKWTREMLLNTLAVTAIGISQIAIGTAIELYSVGIMTHVGTALLNEGVNDLLFASSALRSGYFSWEAYGQHKLESLLITAATVGVGAYFSRGAKVSYFGQKLAGPGFEVGGKMVAEMSGTQLIKTVSFKVVKKEVAKRIIVNAIRGIAFDLANVGVDKIFENYLQALCNDIASCILSNIEQEVERHNISISLKKAFETLGEKSTRKMVNDLTKSVFTEQNCLEKFLPIAKKIVSSVTQGIANAVEKRSKTSNKLELPIHIISRVVLWSERGTHIANIITMTCSFLDKLDKNLRNKLNSEKDEDAELNSQREGYEEFKKEMTGQWKALLREKAGQIITQHIISPILKEGAHHLLRYAGKKMQEAFYYYKESEYFVRFKELKQEYKEKLQSVQQWGNMSRIEDHITVRYHENLRELMIKTRNPDLLADMVRENIPLDMTCVSACTQVIHKMLKERGVTIIVEGDNDIRQKVSSAPDGGEGVIIKLKLQNNHFQLSGSGASESSRDGESKNNCLYEALAKAIPQISYITPERFRAEVADCIEGDEGIRYHVQQGWHQVPISLGAFGGGERKRSKIVIDNDSSCRNEGVFDNEEVHYKVHEVSTHLYDRFVRFLCFGGIVQRISEQTNVDRGEVVKTGPSQFQDKNSKKGRDIHAAHVIRASEINPKIAKYFEEHHKELVNYLGHTQNVPKYANNGGVGRKVDEFQSSNLKLLGSINFSGNLTNEVENTIKGMKEDFIAAIDKEINRGKISESKKCELIKAKTDISNVPIKQLFAKGKEGYSGEKMDVYR